MSLEEIKTQLGKNRLGEGPLRHVLSKKLYGKGLIIELGTGNGAGTKMISENVDGRPVDTFDWFRGLPEKWRDGHEKGKYDMDGNPPSDLPENVTVHKALFKDSLPRYTAGNKGKKVALLFVDSCLYSSAKTALNALAPLIHSGSIVVFDEFINYPGWEQGEAKAFVEFLAEHNKDYKVLGMRGHPEQYERQGREDIRQQKVAFYVYNKDQSESSSSKSSKSSKKSKASKEVKVKEPESGASEAQSPVSQPQKLALQRQGSSGFISRRDSGNNVSRGDYKVKLVVTYGRRKYFECLLPYILRELNQFDEVLIWENTKDEDDLKFLNESLNSINNTKIVNVQPDKPTGKRDGVYPVYQKLQDPKTIYVKVDDDVVWVAPGAFADLIQFCLNNRNKYSVISANMVNSGPLDANHQASGASSDGPITFNQAEPYKGLLTADGATQVHESLQKRIKDGSYEQYYMDLAYLNNEPWSINCIAWAGSLFNAKDVSELAKGDENYITRKLGTVKNKKNAVCPTALMAHFSHAKQRTVKKGLIKKNKKDSGFDTDGALLKQYRDWAQDLLQNFD